MNTLSYAAPDLRRRTRPLPGWAAKAGAAMMVSVSIAGLIAALVGGQTTKLPGAVVSTLMYGSLSLLMLRGHAWARWALFAFAVLTAGACLVLCSAQFDQLNANNRAGNTPILFALVVTFALAGAGLVWRYPAPEKSHQA